MKLKKILVIYTGGTFGMRATDKDFLVIPNLTAAKLKQTLKKQVPEMMKIASCDVKVLFNTDSCQMQPLHWFELAAYIFENQARYEGVVILHGTDTLAYTASALSQLLSPSKIPIVITGAQSPLSNLRSDARQNFISALEVAATAPQKLKNRIMVLFHDELFLGSRVRKKAAVGFNAFESPRFPLLATIGSEVIYHDIINHLPALKRKKALLTEFKGVMSPHLPQIMQTQVNPGFSAEVFTLFNEIPLLEKFDGILLTLYASGTAPTEQSSFQEFLELAKDYFCPIFAITERENAVSSLSKYAAGRDLMKLNVLWCSDLTPEAAYVKAWLLKEQFSNLSRQSFYQWLQKNWLTALSDETSK